MLLSDTGKMACLSGGGSVGLFFSAMGLCTRPYPYVHLTGVNKEVQMDDFEKLKKLNHLFRVYYIAFHQGGKQDYNSSHSSRPRSGQ